jgi:hypothetical protein
VYQDDTYSQEIYPKKLQIGRIISSGKQESTMSSVPAVMHRVVSPSNTDNLPDGRCRALYVGVGGNVSVILNGVTCVYQGVPSGSVLPINADRVTIANTSASAIIALY